MAHQAFYMKPIHMITESFRLTPINSAVTLSWLLFNMEAYLKQAERNQLSYTLEINKIISTSVLHVFIEIYRVNGWEAIYTYDSISGDQGGNYTTKVDTITLTNPLLKPKADPTIATAIAKY